MAMDTGNQFLQGITSVFNIIGSILNAIILGLLTLDTVRIVLRNTGWFPRDNSLWNWLYRDYDRELVKKVFVDLGYSEKDSENNIKKIKKNGYKTDGKNINDNKVLDKLLYNVAQYTSHYEKKIGFGGGQKSNNSNYYINTMEAVHNAAAKIELADFLERKILKTETVDCIDFILVPKGGNPLLGLQVAEDLECELIIAKDSNDSAQVKKLRTSGTDEQKDDDLKRTIMRFEGYERLLNKRIKNGRKLYGIAIDDNSAGGSLLTSMVNGFNNLIEEQRCEIEKVRNCYVLFKIVKYKNGKEIDTDAKFNDKGIELYRFFDLSEENKKELYESLHQDEEDEDDFYIGETQEKLKKVRDVLYNSYDIV